MTKKSAKNQRRRVPPARESSSSSSDSLYSDRPFSNGAPAVPHISIPRSTQTLSQADPIRQTQSGPTADESDAARLRSMRAIFSSRYNPLTESATEEQRGRPRSRELNTRRERYPDTERSVLVPIFQSFSSRPYRYIARPRVPYSRYSHIQHFSFLVLRRHQPTLAALYAAYMVVGAYVLQDPEMADWWSRQLHHVLFESYLASCRDVYRGNGRVRGRR